MPSTTPACQAPALLGAAGTGAQISVLTCLGKLSEKAQKDRRVSFIQTHYSSRGSVGPSREESGFDWLLAEGMEFKQHTMHWNNLETY